MQLRAANEHWLEMIWNWKNPNVNRMFHFQTEITRSSPQKRRRNFWEIISEKLFSWLKWFTEMCFQYQG